MKSCLRAFGGFLFSVLLVGVRFALGVTASTEPGAATSNESVFEVTARAVPTDTPVPTPIPEATATPAPTPTPTATPAPRWTPVPTPTPAPTATSGTCFAPDGSHRQTNLLIKYELLFPESFEHVETRAMLSPDGRVFVLEVELTALNVLGQRVRGLAYGEVDAQSCAALDGGLLE
ncbi:MAG: hypothetical protein OXG33_04305 [Chloroflexi bacterium]|nr:hypothetical protein [Chloroflexota bacterium]